MNLLLHDFPALDVLPPKTPDEFLRDAMKYIRKQFSTSFTFAEAGAHWDARAILAKAIDRVAGVQRSFGEPYQGDLINSLLQSVDSLESAPRLRILEVEPDTSKLAERPSLRLLQQKREFVTLEKLGGEEKCWFQCETLTKFGLSYSDCGQVMPSCKAHVVVLVTKWMEEE